MLTLFNDYVPTHGAIDFGRFRVLKELLDQMLEKNIAYYRMNRKYIDSRHPLVNVLNSINVPFSLDNRVYNDRVVDLTMNLCRIFGYTSAVSRGTVHYPSMFYGDGVYDAVLFILGEWDLDTFVKNWRNYSPIRVLRHPRNDLGLYPLNGNFPSGDEGFCVVSIDLPMLALQYKLWYEEEGLKKDGEEESIPTFLSRYPLTNMQVSHLDVAIFNRLATLAQGKRGNDPAHSTPFWQLDLSRQVDDILLKELASLADRKLTFDDQLIQLPAISQSNMFEVFETPMTGFWTKQVTWVYSLYLIPVLQFLVQQNAKNANPRNTEYLKDIRRFFISAGNDRDLLQALPSSCREMVEDSIRIGILPYLETNLNKFTNLGAVDPT
jgi:hypothetical protein